MQGTPQLRNLKGTCANRGLTKVAWSLCQKWLENDRPVEASCRGVANSTEGTVPNILGYLTEVLLSSVIRWIQGSYPASSVGAMLWKVNIMIFLLSYWNFILICTYNCRCFNCLITYLHPLLFSFSLYSFVPSFCSPPSYIPWCVCNLQFLPQLYPLEVIIFCNIFYMCFACVCVSQVRLTEDGTSA